MTQLEPEPKRYSERDPVLEGFDGVGGWDKDTKVPHRFTAARDDRLMNSIFDKYAIEVQVDDQRTGTMFCNKEGAKALSDEVLATHADWNSYPDQPARFEDIWNHFDVNHDGLVEAERMPQFLRMLLGNNLVLDLQ